MLGRSITMLSNGGAAILSWSTDGVLEQTEKFIWRANLDQEK